MKVGTLEIDFMTNMARLVNDMRQSQSVVASSTQSMEASFGAVRGAVQGLLGTLTAGMFINLIRSSIDAMDHLNDLSKSTNIAVTDLAGLKLAAKQSGSDLDAVAKAINKMQVEIGKDPGRFKEVGLTAKDNIALLKQMADIFTAIEDPQLRAAVAAGAMGRQWAELAPLLAEGSEKIQEMIDKGRDLSGVTEQNVKDADQFNDRLAEMQSLMGGMVTRMASSLLPLMTAFVEELGNGQTAGKNANDLGFNPIVETMRALIVFGGNVVFVLKTVGKELGVIAAQGAAVLRGDFREALEIGRQWKVDAQLGREAFDAWEKKMMEAGKTAKAVAAETTNTARLTAAQVKALRSFAENDSGGKPKTPKGKTDKETEFERYNKLLEKRLQLEQAQLANGGKLTELQQFTLDVITHLNEKGHLMTEREREALVVKADEVALVIKGNAEYEEALRIATERQKARKDEDAAIKEHMDALDAENRARTKAGKDMLDMIRFETDAMTMSTDAAIRAMTIRELESMGIKQGTADWLAYGEAIIAAALKKNEVQQAISDFRGMWDSVDRTAHDVFVNIFEGGKDAFTKLRDTLKATLLDLLYQMTVRKWIFDIVANVSGAGAGVVGAVAQQAGVNAAGSSLVSLAGSALGTSALTAGAGHGLALTMTGGVAGTASAFSGGAAAMGAGSYAGGAGMMVGAAIPYVAIALALYAMFAKSGGGPKVESGFDPTGLGITAADLGRGDPAGAKAISDSITGTFNQVATSLGLLNNKIEVGVFTALDPKGDAQAQLQVVSSLGYNRADMLGGIENAGRNQETLAAAAADETMRVVLDGLKKQVDLAQDLKDILGSVSAFADAATIKKAIDQVVAISQERQSLEATLFDLTATDLEKITKARDEERKRVHETNRALLERIYAEQDAKRAMEEATAAAEAKARADEEAAEAARRAEADARNAVLDSLEAAYDTLQRAVNDQKQALQEQAAEATKMVNGLRSMLDLLNNSVRDIHQEVASVNTMNAAKGQAFIALTLARMRAGGSMPDLKELQGAIAAARGGIRPGIMTAQDAEFARMVLAGQLQQLAELTEPQLTTAEATLQAAQEQIEQLDRLLSMWRDAIDFQMGDANAVQLSVRDAVNNLTAAFLRAFPGAKVPTAGGGGGPGTGATGPYVVGPTSGPGGTAGGATGAGNRPTIIWAEFQDYFATHGHLVGGPARMAQYLQYYGETQASAAKALGLDPAIVKAYFDRDNIPYFEQGTGRVPFDMLAYLHADEAVAPANVAQRWRDYEGGDIARKLDLIEQRLRENGGKQDELNTFFDDISEGGTRIRVKTAA